MGHRARLDSRVGVFGTVVLIGLGVYVFMSNVDIEDATPDTAELSFQEVRAQFMGLNRSFGSPVRTAESEPRSCAGTGQAMSPESLHVMVWDPVLGGDTQK